MQSSAGNQADSIAASLIYAARYGYSDTVVHSENQIRVFPREGEGQRDSQIEVWSIPSGQGADFTDQFGNRVRRLRIVEPHTSFIVAAGGSVRLSQTPPVAEDVSIGQAAGAAQGAEFRKASPLVERDAVRGLAIDVAGEGGYLLEAVSDVIQWIYENIAYRRGATSVRTTAEQVLAAGEGVCQDKTHLALGMLRAIDIPCRYASGLLTGQVGESHSWVEVFHPESGWLGADPTRGVMLPPPSDYVKFGTGRDYTDVSPVTGWFTSTGRGEEISAIADVRFGSFRPALNDALNLLEGAYVVRNEADGPAAER